jgi:cytochrome d ubiquinol oxidase subunit I
MDTLTAARAQMTLTLAFHMVFAAIGIGLPFLMAIAEWRYLKTNQPHYLALAKKWAKATGLLFAIGAISGTALAFELGLLWPHYMKVIGPAVGHLFGLEGFAFFIEAIFIGLYLYGWNKLSPKAHWLCGVVIAFSGAASGILVLGVNSWMQQPVGVTFENGAVTAVDPFAVFKSYAWFTMGLHSTLACYVSVAFGVAAIYAAAILRGQRDAYHISALKIAMAVGAVTAILQPISGDLLGKFVFKSQPAKFAAMEGQFKTEPYAPLRLGGIPDEAAGETKYALEIPGGLSFLADGNPATVVKGLNDIPREHWPNLHLTHFSFQIMVALGTAMMLLALWFWLAWWRKKSAALDSKWLLRALLLSGSFGFIALEAGWVVTEAGRQPWVIQPNPAINYEGMLTSAAVTNAGGINPLFFTFTLLYIALAVIVIVLLRGIQKQPVTEKA